MAQAITALEGIGFGVLALSLYPLGKSFFPDPIKYTTTVRVHAGEVQSGEESANTGGHVPGVGVFDGNGGRIGFMSGTRRGMIDQNNWHDVGVDPINSGNNADAEYISVVGGGSDAIIVGFPTTSLCLWSAEASVRVKASVRVQIYAILVVFGRKTA